MVGKEPIREGEILLYKGSDGAIKLDVLFEDESFWLTQKRMAELFAVTVSTINEHLSNIFKTNELDEESVIRKFRITAADGKAYLTSLYNLDVIIAVGYRVNSKQATGFRIWATSVLREYIVKGYAMDDERLKQGKQFGRDYFDDLLVRIRDIRASERRFYLKLTDIYEQCSIDYAKDDDLTQTFFKTVQNKLHWAITGMTAAELIAARVDPAMPNMGLQTWKGAPEGRIVKADTTIAKNYMSEDEMKSLDRVVSMYLDFAENQAARQIAMCMADWVNRLDAFLVFNDYEILKDAGKVSAAVAKALAEDAYDVFRVEQDRAFESDFERAAQKILTSPNATPKKKGDAS